MFEEACALVQDYMKTDAYEDLLKCIRKAVAFADEDQ